MDGIVFANELTDKVGKVTNSEKIARRQEDLQKSFENCLADHLQQLVEEEASLNCNGCRIDHPSQRQHGCVMMNLEEKADMFLYRAILKMDQYDVMEKWYPQLQTMNLDDEELVEAYRLWKSIKHKRELVKDEKWLDYLADIVKKYKYPE